IAGTEEEWGAWGTVYYDDDARVLGSMQYGPSDLFPRASELPAGPPSHDAVLVTCAYLTDPTKPWVMQSLFLTAIGEARDRGARALEAFAYHYPEGSPSYDRFHVHKTIFPRDFLSDFGFQTMRIQRRVEHQLGDLDRVQRGTLVQVVAGEEEREAVLRRAVGADASDEHLIGLRRVLRRRNVDDLDRRRVAQESGRLVRAERTLEFDPHRLGVAHEHRHADGRRADGQLRELHDLARLRA